MCEIQIFLITKPTIRNQQSNSRVSFQVQSTAMLMFEFSRNHLSFQPKAHFSCKINLTEWLKALGHGQQVGSSPNQVIKYLISFHLWCDPGFKSQSSHWLLPRSNFSDPIVTDMQNILVIVKFHVNFEMLNSTLTTNPSTLAWSNGRVGFQVQFPAMLYTCVNLDILKSTLGSCLPGSIPGHAHVYNFFNSFVNLQDQLYIIYIGLHRGL